jgi:DNA-binding NarL/FixJ family response regulator
VKPIRVLLADDAAAYRALLRLALEEDGRFAVVGEAGDGLEAVQLSDAERPDVLLLDLAMPVMDGLQAIPEVRSRSPETKIVVLSGFSQHRLSKEAESVGASAYLEKGADVETIADTLIKLGAD